MTDTTDLKLHQKIYFSLTRDDDGNVCLLGDFHIDEYRSENIRYSAEMRAYNEWAEAVESGLPVCALVIDMGAEPNTPGRFGDISDMFRAYRAEMMKERGSKEKDADMTVWKPIDTAPTHILILARSRMPNGYVTKPYAVTITRPVSSAHWNDYIGWTIGTYPTEWCPIPE